MKSQIKRTLHATGRSMIEMLGVLAIIGVLSIGGIALYRRAVNNHHANTILDDVNRFAFAIIEKGNYPLEAVIPKGDFKESGIYTLEGYQDAEANQFSITVTDVPKGVCEPLLDKATVEYKVRVNPSKNEKGKLYDTLNRDLCTNDTNIMVFYFGDTTDLCNPKEDGYTPCTVNSDCCGDYFCAFENPNSSTDAGIGQCRKIEDFSGQRKIVNGVEWITSKAGTWWSAQNWCAAQGKRLVTRDDLGCGGACGTRNHMYCVVEDCGNLDDLGLAYRGSMLRAIQDTWTDKGWYWSGEAYDDNDNVYVICFSSSVITNAPRNGAWNRSFVALCR